MTVLTTHGTTAARPTGATSTPQTSYTYVEHRKQEVKQPAHGLAVASLVLGVLGFVGLLVIGPLLAIIFGYVARSRIKNRNDVGGDGMAVAGIILGWIGLILTALIGIGLLMYEPLPAMP